MKFLSSTTLLATLLAATSIHATALGNPRSLGATGNTFDLTSREIKSQKGVCMSSSNGGGCKVPGGVRPPYPCIYSHCGAADVGKNCTIAVGMHGRYEAKCPTNDLPYDWAWPWVPPPKNKEGKGS